MYRARILALAAALAGFTACDEPASVPLLVATSWPAIDRRLLETEFQSWIAASHAHLGHRRIRLEWLVIGPGDDLVGLALRGHPPEVVLGGSAAALARLAAARHLAPIDCSGSSLWCLARRTTNRPANDSALPDAPDRNRGGQAPRSQSVLFSMDQTALDHVFDDPRGDPISLSWALSQLDGGTWRDGYARLVRAAGHQGRISRRAGPAHAGVPGGTGALASQTVESPFHPKQYQGVAILRAARHQDLAQGFLRFLADTRGLLPDQTQQESDAGVKADVASLVADLLGATLVDAQDELWGAWASLERAGEPSKALVWLSEPPPWPPASVAKYLQREGEHAMFLTETLAAELAPEPAARGWLIRSWLSPERIVDDKLLAELALAVDGRLCREPRFRAWLREEWTASARQRYRRVARWAASTATPPR
jgi:hypothetical protein